MTSDVAELRSLVALGAALNKLAATAKANKKALHGSGFYAVRFQSVQNRIERLANRIAEVLKAYPQLAAPTVSHLLRLAATVRDTNTTIAERRAALAEVTRLVDVHIAPVIEATGSPTVPKLNEVLPPQ